MNENDSEMEEYIQNFVDSSIDITDVDINAEEQALLDSALEEIQPETNQEPQQEIPVNSSTLLLDETTSRFSSAEWFNTIKNKVITVAGIGGIGSFVTFLLSRLKPLAIYMYDSDRVETVNMAGQLYSTADVENYKVTAMAKHISDFSNYNSCFAISENFTEDSEASDIMICGFDNMQARKLFFNKWVNHVSKSANKDKCLFIDGRLEAEMFQVLCITGDDEYNIERYAKEFLFSDAETEETICSYKQTTFCSNMIASVIVNLFVNFCANEVGAYRELPFFTSYNAITMYLKTES